MTTPSDHAKGPLYRSRNGFFLGVCRGIAERQGLPVFWTRVFVFVLMILTGFWPTLFLYLIAAMVLKPEPVVTPKNDGETEFYDSYANDRRQALARLKRTYDDLTRRIQRIEAAVTSREFEWERKLRE